MEGRMRVGGYREDHDSAPHLGLSRIRFLKMCSVVVGVKVLLFD